MNLNAERRWQVRLFLLAVNTLLIGIAFYGDYLGIALDAYKIAMGSFATLTGIAFVADYGTKSDK